MPPKKAAPKKSAAKQAAPKKTAPKKPVAKKTVAKKAAAKKAATPAVAVAKPKPTAKKSASASKATKCAAAGARISNKSSGAANTSYAQWFWEGDGGQWIQYDVKQNQVIEDGYQRANGAGVVQMSFNNWNYDINYTASTQTNRSTKRVRNMKREMTQATSASIQKSKESASGKRQRAVQKGNGVVDPLSGKGDSYHVYESASGDVFQCTLNQTNVGTNNNKFYVLQLLEEDNGPGYYLFTRWGRVGVDGQMLTEQFANLSAGVAAYKKKFHDKTRNDWDSRASFVKVPGKYFLMQIDYTGLESSSSDDEDGSGAGGKRKVRKAEAKQKASTAASSSSPTASQLPQSVQEIMKMIGSKEAMTNAMRELDIDTSRMPLGKISKAQIKQAYGYLRTIEQELKKARPSVEEATGLFYTLIPHDFGFRRPPLINSVEMLKEKMDMLEALGQLEIASRLLDTATQQQVNKNPLDEAYEKLGCEVAPVDKNSPEFKRIALYAKNTQGKTHTSYGIEVEEVFALCRQSERAAYKKKAAKLDNRQMLWHGSRTTNFMGILSQGLRIAPPEAPVTGYMFGKGLYFADCCSKSANYCWPTRANNAGLMLLCEVALGKQKTFTNAKYMTTAPCGFDSTKGVGSMFPDEKGSEVVDGVTWPMGKMTSKKVSTSLLYPEYIVYDTNQCQMQYLVKMRFKFN